MEFVDSVSLNLCVERDPIDEEAYITETSSCQVFVNSLFSIKLQTIDF